MSYDLLIRNGIVIDGTGNPGFEADVAVEGERISGIPKNLGLGQKEDGVRAIVFMLEEAVWKVTGLPAERVKILRDAFAKTMRDPEFLDEIKRRQYELDSTPGEELEALAKEVIVQPGEVIERMRKLLEK